ncbi:hypothetical protein BaRGS_00009116 [Batillaria attramentaria]|uniref:Uncharacterized protein n=1 Tax=Batillaria attramentaria TaxID=370345 RepID=A0ABD0LKI4_9CAEN
MARDPVHNLHADSRHHHTRSRPAVAKKLSQPPPRGFRHPGAPPPVCRLPLLHNDRHSLREDRRVAAHLQGCPPAMCPQQGHHLTMLHRAASRPDMLTLQGCEWTAQLLITASGATVTAYRIGY